MKEKQRILLAGIFLTVFAGIFFVSVQLYSALFLFSIGEFYMVFNLYSDAECEEQFGDLFQSRWKK